MTHKLFRACEHVCFITQCMGNFFVVLLLMIPNLLALRSEKIHWNLWTPFRSLQMVKFCKNILCICNHDAGCSVPYILQIKLLKFLFKFSVYLITFYLVCYWKKYAKTGHILGNYDYVNKSLELSSLPSEVNISPLHSSTNFFSSVFALVYFF